jgi:hypothetical protein
MLDAARCCRRVPNAKTDDEGKPHDVGRASQNGIAASTGAQCGGLRCGASTYMRDGNHLHPVS